MCDFYVRSVENSTITDTEGNQYIDFAIGVAVPNTGHRHPRLVRAIEAQLQIFTHMAYQIVPYESYVSLAKKINAVAPVDGKYRTTSFTTGAEAIEDMVEIARAHTGRPGVITFGGGPHRRTYVTMALTGKVASYKKGFGPFPGFVYHALYPSELQGISTASSLKAIECLFKAGISPTRVATIISEPVQGEEGFVVAPLEFMAAIRRICDEHGIVMIADEVQSGLTRTDQLFVMNHYAGKADLMTMAKSLAGGILLSGVAGKARIMDASAPSGLGGTYVGNPLPIAAAHAVLDIVRDEQSCQRTAVLGEQLHAVPTDAQAGCPKLVEVCGLGPIIAAGFCGAATGEPDTVAMQRVQRKALKQGLLLLTCGQYGNIIRFLHPLTIPQDQFAKAFDIIKAAAR